MNWFALECSQDGMHDGCTLHCTVAFQRLCCVLDYVECIGCLVRALQCALHCMPLLRGQWSAFGVAMYCHDEMQSGGKPLQALYCITVNLSVRIMH